MNGLQAYREGLALAELHRRIGWVRRLQGLAIEAEGPHAEVGELCRISSGASAGGVLAEVVGLGAGRVTLLAYGGLQGVALGAEVRALRRQGSVVVGDGLLGRVIDAFGMPMDDGPPLQANERRSLHGTAPTPLTRPRIVTPLETGVRCIDALLTLGQGQRVGIFAGSGVGKSTLLGMIARHARADVNVVALVGERSREVREFIEKQLGSQGLTRTVVVVASAGQAALARVRAAHVAVTIASHFAERGDQVLLMLDSITRLAMARRDIGLAAGEPATARGYTPSVFAELSALCERCGTWPSGGAITALLTVLVEGDDPDEPVADTLRAILDGHVVLARELAQQGHHPAIDVLRSTSRLFPDLATEGERELAATATRRLALLERHRAMVELGAYQRGSNAALDEALDREAVLRAWQCQSSGGVPRAEALRTLAAALTGKRAP